jgi:anti-sigma regulatory factor (Ser/Thr protein kinase)
VSVHSLRLDCGQPITAEVADFVCGLAARVGLSQHKAYWLRLAVDEITTNIADHGYRGSGPLWLYGEEHDDRACVRIEDEGPAFDPRTHDPGPHLAKEPGQRAEGGYGLLLALHRLDAFSYERTAGTNKNTLIMYRDPVKTDSDGAKHAVLNSPARR